MALVRMIRVYHFSSSYLKPVWVNYTCIHNLNNFIIIIIRIPATIFYVVINIFIKYLIFVTQWFHFIILHSMHEMLSLISFMHGWYQNLPAAACFSFTIVVEFFDPIVIRIVDCCCCCFVSINVFVNMLYCPVVI